MAIDPNDERLLTVNDVAARLQVHPITVRRHIKAGKLRAVRVGRSVRIREAALEEYLGAEDYDQVEYPTPTPEAIAAVRGILALSGILIIVCYSSPVRVDRVFRP